MITLCDHNFEVRDPEKPEYSLIEFDLQAKLSSSIRKNFATNQYEIFNIDTDVVTFKGTLAKVAAEANRLEGAENIKVLLCRDCMTGKKSS